MTSSNTNTNTNANQSSSSKEALQSIKFRPTDFVSHHVSSVVDDDDSGPDNHPMLPHTTSRQNDDSSSSRHQEVFFEENYETLHLVGKGRQCQSQVFCCRHKATQKLVAVKIWRKSKQQGRRRRRSSLVDMEAEAAFEEMDQNDKKMSTSTHSVIQNRDNPELHEFYRLQDVQQYPNIVRIYELLEGPTHYYMVMDYVGGGTLQTDLQQQNGERYPEDKAAMVVMEILRAVSYLHSATTQQHDPNQNNPHRHNSQQQKQPIIHCDLNLSNILLDEKKEKISLLKLVDFGEAVCYSEDIDDADDTMDWYKPRGAQLAFMAPEMLAWDRTFGPSCDVWSIGVIGYVLLSGRYPFGHDGTTSTMEFMQNIRERVGNIGDNDDIDDGDDDSHRKVPSLLFDTDLVWNDVSDNAKDFIQSLLQPNPEDRPTAEEALDHVWMEQIRQRALHDKLAGGSKHLVDHAKQVWNGLKKTARRRASKPKVLKQAALTLIASQLVLKEEKAYIDEIFRLMDVQADGVLTKEEVRMGYFEIFNEPLKETDLETLFAKVDKSKAGTIEYSEFVIASLNEKQLLHTDKLNKAFASFDTDDDGFISAEEIRPLLQSYLEEHDENEHVSILESIIAQVDRDGDGKISKEEFMAMMLHSSNGRRRRSPQLTTSRIRRQNHDNSPSSSVTSSLTTSMLMTETPNVFASTTSSLSSGKRRSLWESSVKLTFRPENIIGKRVEQLTKYYDIGEYIQSGAFGSVWFCTHKESGAERAVKYVKKSKHEKENELILREFVSFVF